MTKISKEPWPGISEKEREANLAKVGFSLRKDKRTGGFYTVKKKQAKNSKK